MDDVKKTLEFDARHIWHPYTSVLNPLPVYPVKRTSGCNIVLEDGKILLDGMSSWWAAIHGYNHPEIIEAVKQQCEIMPHVMFGGLTHEPAVKLATKLINLAPKDLDIVFYSDSGSVSVEVAAKMAFLYWMGKNPKKKKLLSVRGGYHGDTFKAMSVCDPGKSMHAHFGSILPQQIFAPRPEPAFGEPWNDEHFSSIDNIVRQRHEEIAAVILEPIVQGAGGMRFYSPEYLRCLRGLCDSMDVLLIADEIATGFGRAGKMFACEYADISPDIMCLGKALTGGIMTLGATLTTNKVARGICESEPGILNHGPTFMANPLALSAALASLTILEKSPWKKRVKNIETSLKEQLKPLLSHNRVKDVRVLGAIGVVETTTDVNMAVIQKFFVNNGVWIRPFGKLVYLMPPYVITSRQLSLLTGVLSESLNYDSHFND